jgi:hypothetical protein
LQHLIGNPNGGRLASATLSGFSGEWLCYPLIASG